MYLFLTCQGLVVNKQDKRIEISRIEGARGTG
jgi:hypothetical protein